MSFYHTPYLFGVVKQSLPIPSSYLVKNLFFDLDDTLWATFENNKNSLKQLYQSDGWNRFYPTFEELFSVYMPINERLWAEYRAGVIDKATLIIDRLRLPLDRFLHYSDQEYWQLNNRFLTITGQQTLLIPQAKEVLAHLHRYYNVYILSNGFKEVQFSKIDNSGLSPFIDQVILSDIAKANKPNKKIFDYACSSTNSRYKESVMIGDSWEADVVGAVNAGMSVIWFNPNQKPIPQEASSIGATYQNVGQIQNLADLLSIF